MTNTPSDDRPCPFASACGSCRCDANIFGTAAVRHVPGLTLGHARALLAGRAPAVAPSRPPAATGATEQPTPGTRAGVLPAEVEERVRAAVALLNERFPLPPGLEFAFEPMEDGPAV